MEEVGRRVETFGDYTAEIVVDGSDAYLSWSKAEQADEVGPGYAKKEHAEEVKELQAAVKDVGKMLTAQRDRIDGLFLARKSWPFPTWRERYLDHPLVGSIARRLIWAFETEGMPPVDGSMAESRLVGVDDAADRGPRRIDQGLALAPDRPDRRGGFRLARLVRPASDPPALQAGVPRGLRPDRRRAERGNLLEPIRGPHPAAAPVPRPLRARGGGTGSG